MTRVRRHVLALTSLFFALGATPTLSAGPPNPTQSDANGNTAGGTGALSSNTGFDDQGNTAFGFDVLFSNTTGYGNTATGDVALFSNTIGYANTASGVNALYFNTTGSNNTATGATALLANTSGVLNTADGAQALYGNETGAENTASGVDALFSNTTGNDNTAVGVRALFGNTAGNNNIALGAGAGSKLTSGNSNIYLGNQGSFAESRTMRLGQSQKATYIAGIASTPISGSTVVINNKGQLGIFASSARYKLDIKTMGDASERLLDLRPVTFRYKQDSSGERQYGLVAEEVARVYPELVVRSASGQAQSVKYEELIPMLLNEVQQQHRKQAELEAQNAKLDARNESLRAALKEQNVQNAAMLARLSRLEEGTARTTTVASR